MTAEEKSEQNSRSPGPKRSADEIAEIEARADEARQALTGMIFAALKTLWMDLNSGQSAAVPAIAAST